jgi:uncharacterized protein (TIGR03437 family)
MIRPAALYPRIVLLVAACGTACGGTVVVPNINTTGNSPFPPFVNPRRIQEVIGGGQFPGAILITGIHLRSAVGKGPVSFNYSSVKVTVSTTQAFPNTTNGRTLPSNTYANNVGPDAATVYNAALSGSSPGCAGPAPCPFDLPIPFNVPFSFDPARGRLLVDIVFSAASGTPAGMLDGVTFPDTNSSSVVNVRGDSGLPDGALNLGGLVFGLDTTTPLISAVQNAASNIAPGLPNAGIAQGSIFVVKGSGLGPANLSIAPAAFQSTTLSGTSVAVTLGTTIVPVPLYYTSDGQVAALLPSNTPTGSGTVAVTYNGQIGPSASINVVANNLAIFTVDSTGMGPAIVTYPDYSLVSPSKAANCGGPNTTCGAANPGDTLILWGTGLGPVSGNDASGTGLGQNMPNLPLTVWLGGVQAPVAYQGRSGCCIGEDQIVFTVPNNLPTGCAVPLVVQINNQVSNSTMMPVANGSRTCTGANPALASVGVQQLAVLNSFTFGGVELDHFLNDSGSGYFDQAQFYFLRASSIPSGSQPFLASYLDQQPTGTCTVFFFRSPTDTFFNSLNLAPIDAGSSFTITGPNGAKTVTANQGDRPVLGAAGTYLVPGDYTITGGPGKDVGPFTAHISIPASPTLTSPASASNFTVTRAKGMTVTWNTNGSTGHVELVLISGTSPPVQAVCTAPASAGTFTIPSYVLLALPAGSATGFRFQPGDQGPASSAAFSATGLNAGIAQTFIDGVSFGGFTVN